MFFPDESAFKYLSGKTSNAPPTPNPFMAQPLKKKLTPPLIPERVESVRSIRSCNSLGNSAIKNSHVKNQETFKNTEETLIQRVTTFMIQFFYNLDSLKSAEDFNEFFATNQESISKAFSNYKITLELLEIEQSDMSERISRMDKYTEIQVLFTAIYEFLENYYLSPDNVLCLIENLYNLNYRVIGIQKKGNVAYLKENEIKNIFKIKKKTPDTIIDEKNESDSGEEEFNVFSNNTNDLKENDIFLNIKNNYVLNVKENNLNNMGEKDLKSNNTNRENFPYKNKISNNEIQENKKNQFLGHRITFQKKLEEIFPIYIDSVHSESEMTQDVLSDFNSVGIMVKSK